MGTPLQGRFLHTVSHFEHIGTSKLGKWPLHTGNRQILKKRTPRTGVGTPGMLAPSILRRQFADSPTGALFGPGLDPARAGDENFKKTVPKCANFN